MAKHHQRPQAAGPSQRALRVGELVRHTMAEMLTRGDVHDPVIETHLITVPEVRMSPDLKLATIYVMPLGGRDEKAVVEALERNQPLPARRDRQAGEPEVRARHSLPHRRALRRGGAHRQAAAIA